MNILYVIHKNPDITLGGVERHIKDLSMHLCFKGFNVYMFYPSYSSLELMIIKSKEIQIEKISNYSFNGNELKDKQIEELFRKVLLSYSIDIVHFQHFLGLPLSLIEVARRYCQKVFITIHDYYLWCSNYKLLRIDDEEIYFCFFEKDCNICERCLKEVFRNIDYSKQYIKERREYSARLLKECDFIITPSKYVRDVIARLFNIDPCKIKLIEHGIKHPDYIDFRSSTNINRLNIAYLGAFTVEKGAHIFLRLIDEAIKLRLSKYLSFYIIGEIGYNVPKEYYKKDILKIIGAYKYEDLNRLLYENTINLVLLLSIWPETYSYTLTEAIVNRIPVIATDLGALRQRLSEYSAGFLVPFENPLRSVLDIILDFIKQPELLLYFKKRCEDVSKMLPDVNHMVESYIELYKPLYS